MASLIPDTKPFHPKRWPFYYGYWIAVCMIVGTMFSAPGQTIGVSVFTDFLIDNLGVNRLSISTAYMIGTIISSFLVGYAGILLDRVGIRPVAAFASLGLGLVLVYMSHVDHVAGWFADVMGPGWYPAMSMITVTGGFVLMRFFGQGVLTLASRTMLMEWFIERRGRVNGVAGVFISLMFSGAPLVFEELIQAHTWRGAWQVLGVVIGIGVTVFILLFFRDKPEHCGLEPDGFNVKKPGGESKKAERNYTLGEARKTYVFWIYNLGLSMFSLVMTAIMFHIVSIFQVEGLLRQEAISIFLPASVLAMVLHLVVGTLSDFTSLKYYLFLILGGLTLSLAGVIMLDGPWGKYMIIAGNGVASGMFGTLSTVTWPRFFGREHLGAIGGLNMQFLVFFSALGPFLFGLSQDYFGTYTAAVGGCLGVLVLLILASTRPDRLPE